MSKRLICLALLPLLVAPVTACSSDGSASSGGWCYMLSSENGTPVYSWPTSAYQPMAASGCSQLAADLGSQLGDRFSVVANVPNTATPVCVGEFDSVTVSVASTSSSVNTDVCDPLNFTPPVP